MEWWLGQHPHIEIHKQMYNLFMYNFKLTYIHLIWFDPSKRLVLRKVDAVLCTGPEGGNPRKKYPLIKLIYFVRKNPFLWND